MNGWIVAARLPAEPPLMPAPASRASGSSGGARSMSFDERNAKMDHQADLIAAQCMTQVVDPVTGEVTVKARNLAMLAQAVRLQNAAAMLLVKYQQASWSVESVKAYHEDMLDSIGAAVNGSADRELPSCLDARYVALQQRFRPVAVRAR